MFTRCMQNVSHTFRQTIVYILYTKLKGLRQLNFVYKMYTKYLSNYFYLQKMYNIRTYVHNLHTKLMLKSTKLIVDIMYIKCIPYFHKLLFTICI